MPLALRISHTVDAATLTPSPPSSPWILRYPHSVFSGASRRTRALIFRRIAGRPVLPRMDLVAQRPQAVSAGFRYHAEQCREQGPVRPVQLQAARLPPPQDPDLVAQDQDLR